MEPYLTTAAGVTMPRLIYGTAWKKERTADLVTAAVTAGFRGIDTACQPKHYEEPLVGEALQRLAREGIRRESLYVQTKFTPLGGQDPMKIPYDPEAPLEQQVLQSFAASKRNLQTDYVDSLVLHSPLFPFAHLMRVWRAMEQIAQQGGAKQLGISNCYDLEVLERLHTQAEVKPAVLQNRFYRDTLYDDDLRRWGDAHGVIYQSFWTLTANPHLLGSREVLTLARKYRKTEPQILFASLRHLGIVSLTGTTNPEHMHDDLDSLALTLEPDEVATVRGLITP